MKRFVASIVTAAVLAFGAWSQDTYGQKSSSKNLKSGAAATAPVRVTLPLKDGSVRFAVIGDTGTGTEKQHELAGVMSRYKAAFPFEFVLMMGDNLYKGEKAEDYKVKFEDVYRNLLEDKVKF